LTNYQFFYIVLSAAKKHVMVLNPYALPFMSIELYLKKQYKTSQKYTGIKH